MKQKTSATKDDIWKDAETLSPEDTKDVKVHLSLRLDPHVYRKILAMKKAVGDRTVTSTIERLLEVGMHRSEAAEATASDLATALRNMISHTVAQDDVLAFLASKYEPTSPKEKDAVRTFLSQRHTYDAIARSVKDSESTTVSILEFLMEKSIKPTKSRSGESEPIDEGKRIKAH